MAQSEDSSKLQLDKTYLVISTPNGVPNTILLNNERDTPHYAWCNLHLTDNCVMLNLCRTDKTFLSKVQIHSWWCDSFDIKMQLFYQCQINIVTLLVLNLNVTMYLVKLWCYMKNQLKIYSPVKSPRYVDIIDLYLLQRLYSLASETYEPDSFCHEYQNNNLYHNS